MFCGHCGQPNPESSIQCTSCGKEIRLVPPAAAPAAASAVAPAVDRRPLLSNLANYSGPRGVGGWLLLFCVGTTVLTPIILLMEAANNASNLAVVVLDVAITALALSTGIALWTSSRYALPLVRAYFIAQLALGALMILGGAFGGTADGSAAAGLSRSGIFQGIRTLLVVALWWTYFKKSDRVHATYGRNL